MPQINNSQLIELLSTYFIRRGESKEEGNAPSCNIYNSTAISITHDNTIALTFDSEKWDTDGMHSTVSNTSRITCATPGIYTVYGNVQIQSNNSGSRILSILLNGTTGIARMRITATQGAFTIMNISGQVLLDTGDYIELTVFQNSGSTLTVNANDYFSPVFGATWLRPLP